MQLTRGSITDDWSIDPLGITHLNNDELINFEEGNYEEWIACDNGYVLFN